MSKVITEQSYLENIEAIRRGMFRNLNIDFDTACGYYDWMQGQRADMEREKAQVAEQQKNTRRGGRMLVLRSRLGNLVTLILPQTNVTEQEVVYDSSK